VIASRSGKMPTTSVRRRADLQPEDLPVPVAVDPGSDQGVHATWGASPPMAEYEIREGDHPINR
jgi:hypothetical protein